MRNNAKDTHVPRRIDDCGDAAVPAASAATTSAATADEDLPGWIGDPGGYALPGSSAATAAASGA